MGRDFTLSFLYSNNRAQEGVYSMKQCVNLLWYDIQRGCLENKKKILLLLGIGVASCLWFESSLKNLYAVGYYADATLGDYLFYIFCGINYYSNAEGNLLPQIWLLYQIYIMFLSAYYPYSCLHGMGQQSWIRSNNRVVWWLEKCVWIFVQVILCYTFMLGSVFGYCIIKGIPTSLELSESLCRFYYGIVDVRTLLTVKDFNLILFVVFPFVSAAIGIFQMALGIVLKPQVAFIVTVAYLFSSIYIASPFLLGNYNMLLRYRMIGGENFVTGAMALISSCILIVVAILVGGMRVLNMDVLSKRK